MKLRPKSILLAFIFVYPITPWYITIGPLNMVNIVSMIFIAIWCICSDLSILSFSRTSILFWLYLIVYSLQALTDTSLTKALAYIVSQLFVCIIVYTEITRRNIFAEALHMLVYAAGFLSISGLFEEVTRINIFHIISGLPSSSFYTEIRLGIYRIETSFSHPIVYCGYLCFIAGLLVYLIDHENNNRKKRIFQIIYILVIVNAILTMSRFTLVVLALEQVIFGLMTGVIKFSKKVIGLAVICGFVLIISSILGLRYVSKLKNILYMFLALFDDSYTNLYSTSFGVNESAVGNRLDLFNWVADSVKGHELFGMGTSAEFSYTVHSIEPTWNYLYTWEKTSIENEYLYNYYIHGLVGVVSFILNLFGVIVYSNRMSKVSTVNFEGNRNLTLTFPRIMLILLIGYAVILFSVRSSDNVRIFNVLVCIMFAYHNKLEN